MTATAPVPSIAFCFCSHCGGEEKRCSGIKPSEKLSSDLQEIQIKLRKLSPLQFQLRCERVNRKLLAKLLTEVIR